MTESLIEKARKRVVAWTGDAGDANLANEIVDIIRQHTAEHEAMAGSEQPKCERCDLPLKDGKCLYQTHTQQPVGLTVDEIAIIISEWMAVDEDDRGIQSAAKRIHELSQQPKQEIRKNEDGTYSYSSSGMLSNDDVLAAISGLPKQEAMQPDDDDIALAERYLSELCSSGGKSWCLSIPARESDMDLVFQRLINHAKATKHQPLSASDAGA